MQRWGKHQSLFLTPSLTKKTNLQHGTLNENLRADTVVVGAGITGVTTALLLQQQGQRVILVTDGLLGQGATGHSSGHLTEVPDEDFLTLKNDFGAEKSKLMLEASREAIQTIEKLSQDFDIPCGFQRVPGFRFTESPSKKTHLEEDMRVASELGLQVKSVETNPLPFRTEAVFKVENQALFNPQKYVEGLAQRFVSTGGKIFEQTHIEKIEDGEVVRVHSDRFEILARQAVLATHTPIGHYISLHTRVAPYFSYVMAVRLASRIPEPGLYWDMNDPYHYIRPYEISGEDSDIWIMGGCDHKTGQESSPLERYIMLEQYARARFDISEIVNYWGNEFFEPVDGIPYIGKIPFTQSIYTGTGYSGTGLTFGTTAGKIISDHILDKYNRFEDLFDPARVNAMASAGSFVKENLNVARWFMGDLLHNSQENELHSLAPGEGKVVEVQGKKLAVYRGDDSSLITLSATCTHLGCTVNWNTAEKTWDCPCHGGRFRCNGEVFEGPALKDLPEVHTVEKLIDIDQSLGLYKESQSVFTPPTQPEGAI